MAAPSGLWELVFGWDTTVWVVRLAVSFAVVALSAMLVIWVGGAFIYSLTSFGSREQSGTFSGLKNWIAARFSGEAEFEAGGAKIKAKIERLEEQVQEEQTVDAEFQAETKQQIDELRDTVRALRISLGQLDQRIRRLGG